jgi:hypothetical protein
MDQDTIGFRTMLGEEKNAPKQAPVSPQAHIGWITPALPPSRDFNFHCGDRRLTRQELDDTVSANVDQRFNRQCAINPSDPFTVNAVPWLQSLPTRNLDQGAQPT